MSEKHKNIDMDELKAIIRSASEEARGTYQANVERYANEIRYKIMDGDFTLNEKGELLVRLKLPHLEDTNYFYQNMSRILDEFSQVSYHSYSEIWQLTP